MNLLSMFRRRAETGTAAPVGDDEIARARTRARRRLVGAIVLVTVGVIALPLMFDGEPRPLPPDIPIEIPRKDDAPPLVMPPARPAAASAPSAVDVPAAASPAKPSEVPPAQTAAQPAAPVTPPPSASPPSAPPPPRPVPAAPPSPPAEAARAGADTAKPPPREAERARATLEGKPASAPVAPAPRFVVQVGAFADPASARDAVERVQKLGLKPFTQVVQTDSGPRTRVRLGPFATREEAQRVQARTEAAGIKSAVMPQ